MPNKRNKAIFRDREGYDILQKQLQQNPAAQMQRSAFKSSALRYSSPQSSAQPTYTSTKTNNTPGRSETSVKETAANAIESTSNWFSSLGSDILNSGRSWTKKLVDQFIENDLSDIDKLKQEQEDLDRISEYQDLQIRRKQLRDKYEQAEQYGLNSYKNAIEKDLNNVENKIKEHDSYFLGEGRQHDAVAELMYDKNKLDFADKAYVNAAYAGRNVDSNVFKNVFGDTFAPSLIKHPWLTSAYTAATVLGNTLESAVNSAIGVLDLATVSGGQLINKITGNGDKTEWYKTNEVIKSLNVGTGDGGYDANLEFLNKMYKGSAYNQDDPSVSYDNDRINNWKKYNARVIAEKTATLQNDIKFSKDGKLFGIDIYDPEDIPEQFKQRQEEFGKSPFDYIINPWNALVYTLPETASTFGMAKHQIGAMGVNGALQYVAYKLPSWVISENRLIRGTGKLLSSGIAQSAMRGIAVGSGVKAAYDSRQEETALEEIGALSQRVADIMQRNGSDIPSVIESIRGQAEASGIDTSGFDEQRMIELGIAYNYDTGDPVFDEAKYSARKGLSKLVNANNALAINDYLEALPFMNYSGKILRNWGKSLLGQSAKYPFNYGARAASNSALQSISDAIVGKTAKKFAKEGLQKSALYTKHAGDFLLKGIAFGARQGTLEGGEETIQQLLQDKYQRGLYDSYSTPESTLGINELFANAKLATEAVCAYLGMDPFDPGVDVEEIRKSFHIGFASSLMFSGILKGIGNIRPSEDNLTGLILQMKNDKIVSNMIGHYSDKVQDQQKIAMFFDAFAKTGVNATRLTKSLQDLKEYVDPQNTLVDKEFIDEDIRLLTNAWFMYNNKGINDNLKANGIKKFSDDHKQIVVDGAAVLTEVQKNYDDIKKLSGDIKHIQSEHLSIAAEMLDLNTPEERLAQLEEQYPKLAAMIKDLSVDYNNSYLPSRERSRKAKYANYAKQLSQSIDKFSKNEGIIQYLNSKYVAIENPIYQTIDQAAREVFTSDLERRDAIRFAYDYENRQRFMQGMDDVNQFKRNKYVRAIARKASGEALLDDELSARFRDKDSRRQTLEDAYSRYNDGIYAVDDYVLERVRALHLHNKMLRLRYAKDVAENQAERLRVIRGITGLDTTTDLEGIVDQLNQQLDIARRIEDRTLNGPNTPKEEKLMYGDFFKDKKYEFDDQQDYDQTFSSLLLSSAMTKPLESLANAYIMNGESTPTSLREAIYGKESTDDILKQAVSDYKDVLSEESALGEDGSARVLSNAARLESRAKKLRISNEAAWKVILDRAKKRDEKNRIAHRIYEEEGPITPGYQELKHQEQEAKNNEEQTQSEPQQPEPSTEATTTPKKHRKEAPMSDAEKQLRQTAGMETETLEEKIDRARAIRQAAKEDDMDEDSIAAQSETEEPVQTSNIEEMAEQQNADDVVAQQSQENSVKQQGSPSGIEEKSNQPQERPANTQQESEIPQNVESADLAGLDQLQDVDDLESDTEAQVAFSEKSAEIEDSISLGIDDSWVIVDNYGDLQYNEQGFLTFNGEVLPEDQQKAIEDEMTLLGLDDAESLSQEDLPEGEDSQKKSSGTNSGVANLISQTFFYQPNPKKNEKTGDDELPKLLVNGKPLKLNKPLASGRQLSKKLTQRGWLQDAKKYYVVTQSQQGKKVFQGKDVRDALTVALIIEDEKNCYATFLRPLGLTESDTESGKTIVIDSESMYRNWLRSRNVNWREVLRHVADNSYSYEEDNYGVYISKNGKRLSSKQKVDLFNEVLYSISAELAKSLYYSNNGTYEGFEHWWSVDPLRSDFASDNDYNKAVSKRHRTRKLMRDRALQMLAMPGKKILSDEQIDNEISALREHRNAIIREYLGVGETSAKTAINIPEEARTDVVPQSITQSNGKIDNVRDKYKNPVFRTIVNEGTSLEEVQKDLDDGTIVIGYGKGAFAQKEDAYSIYGVLNKDNSTRYVGKGLSGKIYYFVKSITGDSRVPVMLSEQRFDSQSKGSGETNWLNNKNNIVLCLQKNMQTGEYENTNVDGYRPSAAEVLFYMLIGEINMGLDKERANAAIELFIHSGEKTLLKNQPKSGNDPFNTFAAKQLYVSEENGRKTLQIGIFDGSKYVLKEYAVDDLLREDNVSDRIDVIHAIATQMHWNTDISVMNSSIGLMGTSNSDISAMFSWAVQKFAKEYTSDEEYLNQRIEMFGCPQLSFRLGDFYEIDGSDIKQKQNVSVLAWMLKEGRLMTDASEDIFTAPFVFASGVTVQGGQGQQVLSKAAEVITGNPNEQVIPITEGRAVSADQNFDLYDESAFEDMTGSWRKGLLERRMRYGWGIAKTQEEREQILSTINKTHAAKENGGINDRIVIRSPKTRLEAKDAKKYAVKVIKEFLDKYNKKYPERAVSIDNIQFSGIAEDGLREVWGLRNGYIQLDLYANGTGQVQVNKYSDDSSWADSGHAATGVYSTDIGGNSTVQIEKARAWLSKTLGISKDNIILTNAIMRSATNEQVFGVTNVVLDRLADEITGYMMISSEADYGIEYHEAWHYVNLLMHDRATRARIYQEYVEKHPYLSGKTEKEIEEALADEFKVYMEGFEDKSIKGRITRFFNNVLDFLIASRRKTEYRNVFKAIASGKYAAIKLDQQSIQEFRQKYQNGAFKVDHPVSGISERQVQKLQNMKTYKDILDGTDAIIRRILQKLDISTVKKMREITGSRFDKVLDIVDQMIGEQTDENVVLKLQDLRNNETILRKALIDELLDMGVSVKIKKVEDIRQVPITEENENAFKKEENPETAFDKIEITNKRKDNASLRTKMFLRQIPVYEKIILEDGSPRYVPKRDQYGTIEMYDPDMAWRRILDTLWECDSFGEIDEQTGKYSESSIMGIVEREMYNDTFFYSLYEKLQQLDDYGDFGYTQLKSQIFTTVNSSKNQVAVIHIQNPRRSGLSVDDLFAMDAVGFDMDASFDGVDDVKREDRQWTLYNDSNISTAKQLLRQWSKNLASNGLVVFNRNNNITAVSENFANSVQTDLKEIQKNLLPYWSTQKGFAQNPQSDMYNALIEAKDSAINLYRKLGIQCDASSLNVYIAMMSGIVGELTIQQQLDTLNNIFNTNKIGSISNIIDVISRSKGLSQIKVSSRAKDDKAIDQAFVGYSASTDIGVLATAWSAVHPSAQEFSVSDASGNRLYPINMNSFISDRILKLNDRRQRLINELRKSNYLRHSILINAASEYAKNPANKAAKLKLNRFVGVRDADSAFGADYRSITPIEDYIAKMIMTEKDQLVFPTMADKMTWFSISSSAIKLSHDAMLVSIPYPTLTNYIYEEYEKINPYEENKGKYQDKNSWKSEARAWYRNLINEDPELFAQIKAGAAKYLKDSEVGSSANYYISDSGDILPRFSENTLMKFAGYFIDELNSLIDYYDKDHIKKLVQDKNLLVENFHGNVQNGRMDFSGNGGRFRYFYDLKLQNKFFQSGGMNLNQQLQALFELQKKIEAGTVKNVKAELGSVFQNVSTDVLYEDDPNLDGFELIRAYLKQLKSDYTRRIGYSQDLLNAVNDNLISGVNHEMKELSVDGSPMKLLKRNTSTGNYYSDGIPKQLLAPYFEKLQSYGFSFDVEDSAVFSLIANNFVNTMASVIEVEKIFSGDPAFYKVTNAEEKKSIKINVSLGEGIEASETVNLDVATNNYDNKIKRLGGTLSPGNKLRKDFSERELEFDKTIACQKYTNLNIDDAKVASEFIQSIEHNFKLQLIVDFIYSGKIDIKPLIDRINNHKGDESSTTQQHAIDILYSNQKLANEFYELLPQAIKDEISYYLEKQIDPYKDINVADAQVIIRPDLYRRIRIQLGEWSIEKDETGYSDEEAYNIIEGIVVNEDGTRTRSENPSIDWMKDPKLYRKVRKLQLYPLKMSYFQNDIQQVNMPYSKNGMQKVKSVSYAKPIYNKMAIFPLFAFQRSTEFGAKMYNRMNREGDALDMVSFASAVKAGGSTNRKKSISDGNLGKFNDALNLPSNNSIDYNTGQVTSNTGNNTLAVTVQDLDNIRLQLNTKAHDAHARAIGTQMFKIAFSNIIDDAFYGTGKNNRKARLGRQVKSDIMQCIKALTHLGVSDIEARFYKDDGSINYQAVRDFVRSVIESNGLGESAAGLYNNGAAAESILSRSVFENSASSIVNSEIVDINTNGGTAIQQSTFGFIGYGNQNIGIGISYNDGKELKWDAKEGSMQVILSLNFFKEVVPKEFQETPKQMRDWLLENNVIGENSKPFGVGYRIPTQGMSSMFSFQVADVLPEQVGDLIIVPREFTAQTGSDFDVDKLYLATFSYNKQGQIETLTDEELGEDSILKYIGKSDGDSNKNLKGAISNRLLENYIDIISDRRNYADSRGPIDFVTELLQEDFIKPYLRRKTTGYISGLLPLSPSFQALRKMEFSTGKTGIGPFAWNITNLAQTQYTHLAIDTGNIGDEYGFQPIDKIVGKDGIKISAWLSAMVNAHVDVAKDPYIFAINVNSATYNHVNFLLRSGMGLSTFTFISQQILKDYANIVNSFSGIYSQDGTSENAKTKLAAYNTVRNRYLNALKRINLSDLKKEDADFVQSAIDYFEYDIKSEDDKKKYLKTHGNKKPNRPVSRNKIFDADSGKLSIKYFDSDDQSKIANSIIYQLSCLQAFNEIDSFAKQLSDLVNMSQVDTKQFGNTIADHIDWMNRYNTFRLGSTVFYINDQQLSDKNATADKSGKVKVDKKQRSRNALKKYFNELYLHDKLVNAVRYTRDILRPELISASVLYERVLRTYYASINGFEVYVDENNIPIRCYNRIHRESTRKAVASGIDITLRNLLLSANGYTLYQNEVNKNPDTRMIDFTMGGSENAVRDKLQSLLFDTDTNKSIFTRLAELKQSILEDPFSEKFDGLTDAEGKLVNDLLLYLNPVTQNSLNPVGRIFLQDNQMNNNKRQERSLISAFAQLLEHSNDDIRQLARDLVFFSYYSSYDQNSMDTFFHLVPPEYRRQYDLTIRRSIHGLNNKNFKILSGLIDEYDSANDDTETGIQLLTQRIQDTLARNYWYNDDVVPVYNPSGKNKEQFNSTSESKQREEFVGRSIYDSKSGMAFPTYIASAAVPTNGPYFKIRKGSTTILYKKIGVVSRKKINVDGSTGKETNSYYIYAAVPKLGMSIFGTKYAEFNGGFLSQSLFKENKLPREYGHDLVREEIEKIVSENSNNGIYNLVLSWDIESVPDMYQSSNEDTYTQGNVVKQQTVGGCIIKPYALPELGGQSGADVVIDIIQNELDDPNSYKPGKNIVNKFKDKVVHMPVSGSVDYTIKKILELGKESITLHLTTSIFDNKLEITDDQKSDYINTYLKSYREQLVADGIDNIEELLNIKKQALLNNDAVDQDVRRAIVNDRVHEFVIKLLSAGISVSGVTAAAEDGKTLTSTAVAYIKTIDSDYIGDGTAVTPFTLFMSKKLLSKSKKMQEFKQAVEDIVLQTPPNSAEKIEIPLKNNSLYKEEERVQQLIDKNINVDEEEGISQNNALINGENISSRGSEFAKKLTNIGNNLKVVFRGVEFRNAEHAYQTWKSGEFDEVAYNSTAYKPKGPKPVNMVSNFDTMVEIITAKLRQHPELIQGIDERGGISYLQASTHNVIGDNFWESGEGKQNKFIEALTNAYINVRVAPQEDQQNEEEIPDIIKESQQEEENKENAKHNECGATGGGFASSVVDDIDIM